MRAFVAIEVPGPVLDSLVLFQKELSATGGDMKLVERQNLHFTVKFLGEVTESEATEVGARLGRLSPKAADVEVRGAGAFPTLSHPRVVWAGVSAEHEALVAAIASDVIGALGGIGEKDDRPFRAHITLGRVRSGRNARQLADLLRSSSGRPFGVARLSELKLKSSVLTPAGPIYKNLGVYPLA